MSRRSTLLAVAAAASLGVFALSSTDAFAFHSGGSGMRVGSYSGIHVASPIGHYRVGMLHVIRPWPTFNPHWHWHPHWYWGWRRHFWIAPVVAGGVAATYAATAPASNNCNCLTKTYTQDGAVVFKDVCTNEMAMNPPAGPATGDTAQPQQQGYLQPQQQGYLQPQTQAQ